MSTARYGWRYIMQGAPAHRPRALLWQRRLLWPMFCATLLTIPAFYLDLTGTSKEWHDAGSMIYGFVALVFLAYQLAMSRLCGDGAHYVGHNGIDLLMTMGAALSIAGSDTTWSAIEWLLRAMFAGVVVGRLAGTLRLWFTPKGVVRLIFAGVFCLAVSGIGFLWLEPSVKSYADGLWLAFVSGATVGYGDIVPSTPASRIFAFFIILIGYGILSLVTASLAASFVQQEEQPHTAALRQELRELRQEIASLRAELQHAQSPTKHHEHRPGSS